MQAAGLRRPVRWSLICYNRVVMRPLASTVMAVVLVAACVEPPPFAVLTVEDPDAVATGFATLHVGSTPASLAPVTLSGSRFPLTVTVTARTAGEHTIWAEARDQSRNPLGRGRATARLARRGTPTATLRLARPCDDDAGCADGAYCNGVERCVEGACSAGERPCAANVDCATSECVELGDGAGRCDTTVDHLLCGPGLYCNPVRGCVEGQGCLIDEDCADTSVCNGVERCVNLTCAAGIPPPVGDDDACTIDGCDDSRGAEAIFHVALSSFDGSACQIPGSGADGVCVASKGGCVISACGDGVLGPTEQCEDGNENPNDGCAGCRWTRWTAQVLAGQGVSQGLATAAPLRFPIGVAVDRGGNLFVAENSGQQVRRVDVASGFLMTVAGTDTAGFWGDGGNAATAGLNAPYDLQLDGAGRLYITDTYNHRVRCVDLETGVIDTVAGNGTAGYSGDGGDARAATLNQPTGVTLDADGHLYITEWASHVVRRIDAVTGVITTVAGTGVGGFTGDGGAATAARLNRPKSVAFDAGGNLFISDTSNNRIRLVRRDTGLIETIAGTGAFAYSGDGGPALSAALNMPQRIAFDLEGRLVIADMGNARIRRIDRDTGIIDTVAGSGVPGYAGDGGPALLAQLYRPFGLTHDFAGHLYVGDSNNGCIRRIDRATGVISTVAGVSSIGFTSPSGAATSQIGRRPSGLAVRADGGVIVCLTDNYKVLGIDVVRNTWSRLAGTGIYGFNGDVGVALTTQLDDPRGIALDSAGNLFIADATNQRIRRVDAATGLIATVAGSGPGGFGTGGFSGDGGPATSAQLWTPYAVAVDPDGVLFIADTGNHRIRRVDAVSGLIATIAGVDHAGGGGDDGLATAAELSSPRGLAIDGVGNLFIADHDNHRVRRIDAATGVITTVAGTGTAGFGGDGGAATAAMLNGPYAVALEPDGDLLIADSNNHRVRLVRSADGVITTRAGTGTAGYSGDGGPASSALLNRPIAVQVASDGDIVVGEDGNNSVRRVDVLTGVITSVLGGVDPPGDGPVEISRLGQPTALTALDAAGAVWLVSDSSNGRVRAIDFGGQWLGTRVGYLNGFADEAASARFSRLLVEPTGLALDVAGETLFVSERGGHTLRAVSLADPAWTVSTVAGELASPGYHDAVGGAARFSRPTGLAFDATSRTLFVADSGNHVVRAFAVDTGVTTTIAGTPQLRGFFGEGTAASEALLSGPQALALAPDGSLYVADTDNQRVRRLSGALLDGEAVIDTVVGDGTAAASGEGAPARFFPVREPLGLAVDRFGNLFVASSTALRLVTAGADGVATGDDEVRTLYGRPPRDAFPAAATFCLAGIAVVTSGAGAQDDRLLVLDACAGFLLQLDREAL